MRVIIYLLIGTFFGIVLIKSEAASWFRIFEMFRFDSFHMYGIIGSALALGILIVQVLKRGKIRSWDGGNISFIPKKKSSYRYIIGGTIFGFGWALAGACPGPMFALTGSGYISILIVIAAAVLGTFIYGLLKDHLPH